MQACEACGRLSETLVLQQVSLPLPGSLSYCRQCLMHRAEPESIFTAYLGKWLHHTKGNLHLAMSCFRSKLLGSEITVYREGRYVAVQEIWKELEATAMLHAVVRGKSASGMESEIQTKTQKGDAK